jgi:xylose isomerase
MLVVLNDGGFRNGGLNFDAKVRRESTDLEDMFVAHIGGMDAFARGLTIAHNILQNSKLVEFRKNRYSSFDSGAGSDFEKGKLTLSELRDFAAEIGEPATVSGKQEWVENLINDYMLRG